MLLAQRRHVLDFFGALDDGLPRLILQLLLPVLLLQLLLLLFGDLLPDGSQLLLLPVSDGLGACLALSRFLEDLLLALLIEL